MKVFIYLSLTLFIMQSLYSQTNWEWITPYPPNKIILSSTVGDNKAYFWCEANSVFSLDFETDNFEILPNYAPYGNCHPGSFAYQGIAFADSMNGYITDICTGEFRTTDGGKNWTKTASGSSMVCFGTSLVGWKLGGGGLYKTNNAGATWLQRALPPSIFSGGLSTKLYAINENQLWILKIAQYVGQKEGVWYSYNGGNSWAELNTGLKSDSSNLVSYFDIKINSSGLGYIVGSIFNISVNSYTGFILKTNDMGLNWELTKFPEEKFETVLLLNNQDVIILGNAGKEPNNQILIQRRSSDSGLTWNLSTPISNYATYSEFDDAIYSTTYNSIYLFTGYSCYKSIDNGISYQKVVSSLDLSVSNVTFDSKPTVTDKQLGVAWLKWNIRPYLITTDGGETWQKKSLPSDMGSIWLAGISEEVIYLIANQLQLYKSTDFGETWQKLNLNLYSGLQALEVFSKDEFVLSAWKKLVSSTDGGESWIFGPTLDNVFLETTSISKPGYITGVGLYFDTTSQKGCIFNTSDYGLSWHLFDTDDDMLDVHLFGNIGYALGKKNLYKTIDNGLSWKIIFSRGGSWYQGFSCFAFFDSLNGVIYSDAGMSITHNGGINWTKTDYGVPFISANKIVFNNRGDLFIIYEASMVKVFGDHDNSNDKYKFNAPISDYYLAQNYPNPFNPSTKISWQSPVSSWQTLKIYDVLGNEVATLVNEYKPAGFYEVEFNGHSDSGQNLSSGVYFYQLRINEFVETRKMILLK